MKKIMSDTKEFKIGDVVFYGTHKLTKTKVFKVKNLKRGPKVICEDLSEWDPKAERRWSCRGDSWYTGPELQHATKDLELQYARQVWKRYLDWTIKNFSSLYPEQQYELGELARKIYLENKIT